MSKVGTIIAIIAVLVALVILILSFGVHDPSKFPPQANGTHTGYPVWHPPFPEGSDLQQKDGTILFSAMIMIIAGYLVLKWTNFDARTNKKLLTYFVDKDSNKTSTIIFDRLLAYSCLITALTAVFYYAIDLGKIWSIVGILHNANEVFILVALHQGGKITSSSFIAWLTFYVVFATALSLYLEWPFDAVWFKIQGLCPDYALVIQFIRLYLDTRKGYGDETHQQLLDPERPRRNHTSEEGTSEESASEQEQVDDRITVYFRPYYVLLLVLASIVHIFGNVINAIMIYWFDAYLMFSFSYCITYPLYAYFVYLDTHSVAPPPARKYIILPDTSTPKVILVTASSLFLSLLTIRISMLVTN